MNFKHFLATLVLLIQFQVLIGQTKNEKEERVPLSEFPESAQTIINELPKACKRLKFYKETDSLKHSYEAKFKFKKQRYSLEFSEDGVIEDIEITTKLKHINETSRKGIKSYFQSNYTKYKIIKLQEQFIYNSEKDTSLFLNKVLNKASNITPNFEIIAEVKTDNKRDLREFTFDESGAFLNYRIVNPTSYEHVLY